MVTNRFEVPLERRSSSEKNSDEPIKIKTSNLVDYDYYISQGRYERSKEMSRMVQSAATAVIAMVRRLCIFIRFKFCAKQSSHIAQ